jgi:hypothetical protein
MGNQILKAIGCPLQHIEWPFLFTNTAISSLFIDIVIQHNLYCGDIGCIITGRMILSDELIRNYVKRNCRDLFKAARTYRIRSGGANYYLLSIDGYRLFISQR